MHRPDLIFSSAGLGALEGHPADPVVAELAARDFGVTLEHHRGRQFKAGLGADQDLILVMEPAHRAGIGDIAPQLLGRTMLFDRWTTGRGIGDPYRQSRELHKIVCRLIAANAKEWATRL